MEFFYVTFVFYVVKFFSLRVLRVSVVKNSGKDITAEAQRAQSSEKRD
jgi:hypothetical protein